MIGKIENTSDNAILLDTKFSYFIDESNQLSFNQVKIIANQFTPSASNKIPYKLANESYWLNVSIRNKTQKKLSLTLHADNALLSIFDSYQLTDNGSYQLTKIIDKNADQPIVNLVYPHANFELPPLSTQTFILKIKTDGPPNVPLMVITQKDFQQRILFSQIVYGSFIAIVILMALYNVILFLAIKDKVYLVYIGYLLSSFFILASLTGFGYLIFSQQIQWLINDYLLFIDYYLVIFLLVFTLLFLRYDQRRGKIYQIGKYLSLFLIICSFASLSLNFIAQTKLFFSLQPAIYVFAIFAIVKRLRNDYSWAKYYFYSWVTLLLGAAIQPLVLLNFLDYSFFTSKAFLFAILLEVTLMAFALANRIKRNEQDRNREITHHMSSGLPRKSTIESKISQLIAKGESNFSIVVIKPEQIEKVNSYIDESKNTALIQRLNKQLSLLFKHNDTVIPITSQNEKIGLVSENSFAVLITDRNRQQSLATFIYSIQQIVNENYQIAQLHLPLAALVGVAKFPEHGKYGHQLLDNALVSIEYADTSADKWAYFQPPSDETTSDLFNLASELTIAIDNNQLELYHQPQVDLKTLRICSSECLLRWKHNQQGMIAPEVVIKLAEDLGLINKLTLWVLKRALQQQATLRDEYNHNHMVAINISEKDLKAAHFLNETLDIIENSTIACEKIVFELPQSTPLSSESKVFKTIEQLKEVGITVSMSNFSTSNASLAQNNNIPFQELKIAQALSKNICTNKERKMIVEANVKIAKGLGLEVVAEGINSQEDEDTLRQIGCDIGQGHFYGKAMPFDEYQDWLSRLSNGQIAPSLQGEFIPAEK